MPIFATGLGAEGEVCCCFSVTFALIVVVGASLAALRERSPSITVLSVMLAAFVGFVLITQAQLHEVRPESGDSLDVEAMCWMFVRWWAWSLAAPLAAAIRVLTRKPSAPDTAHTEGTRPSST